MKPEFSRVEYLWLDGNRPTQHIRSKARIIPYLDFQSAKVEDFPDWGYDGSSTYQAEGASSDLILKPVAFVPDPIRGDGSFLVMNEVFQADGQPHPTNRRAELRRVLEKGGAAQQPWIGFEQEFTFFKGATPLGWPEGGYPAPQGPFYCGVGADIAFGRDIVEDHMAACMEAGLVFFGINAEVMPGQWEFQMGYRGVEGETPEPLRVSDDLWMARWLLYRIAEEYGVNVTLDSKPVKGDWNGAGMHTNFSTESMRKPGGKEAINNAVTALEKRHKEHIEVYGHGLESRLTGQHETCHISEFKSGVGNRGASIRIPLHVEEKGYGYFEDRRPGANANPYEVSIRLVKTVCGID